MRRALLIAAAVLFLIASAVAIYFFFFAHKGGTLSTAPTPSFPQGGGAGGTSQNVTLGPGAGTVVAPRFIKITDGPVAQGFVARKVMVAGPANGSSTPQVPDVEVRYIDRASGNVYAFDVAARILSRLSNKTLPGIQVASWLPGGSEAFVQYLAKDTDSNEHVATYALPADGSDGYTLEDGLSQAVAVGSTSVLTVLPNTTGTIATIANANGTAAKTLFTTALSQLIVAPSAASYFAYTPASSGLDGYAFALTKAGTFTRLLGPFRGLSILPSPNGKQVLYSYVDSGTPHLGIIDTTSHAATALPLGTFTEKCVWAANNQAVYCAVPTNLTGTLPDDWYQGALTTSDRIWRIDLASRTASLVLDPKVLANTPLDVVSLTLDPDSTVLIFMDKASGSLWSYSL